MPIRRSHLRGNVPCRLNPTRSATTDEQIHIHRQYLIGLGAAISD
jgi:hypothetical protein